MTAFCKPGGAAMKWGDLSFFRSDSWHELDTFVRARRQQVNVYPAHENVFRAFKTTRFESTNVVILGQDPYHRPGQAHGLCFSVPAGVPAPPSLRNILKEVCRDIGVPGTSRPTDLTDWAKQGVLLLNAILTVEEGCPGAHAKRGWSLLLDETISVLSAQRPHVVFVLWGNHAREKARLIDPRHTVLQTVHPSPLSASRGFHGCGHFSTCNAALEAHGQPPVQWLA